MRGSKRFQHLTGENEQLIKKITEMFSQGKATYFDVDLHFYYCLLSRKTEGTLNLEHIN